MYKEKEKPERGDTITVWFSCGAASAVAAKRTIEKYGSYCRIVVVNNPIHEEHKDNKRFLRDVEKWLGQKIHSAKNPRYPKASVVEVWKDKKWMGNSFGAPCTQELKKRARAHWEKTHHKTDWIVLGFTLEEKKRHERFIKSERQNVLPVLIDERLTKADCFNYLMEEGLTLPKIYKMGYPNANCIGCIKISSASYWNLVRRKHPSYFWERAKLSRELGAKLVKYKNKRIYLDELPFDAKSHDLKNLQVECGIFCEE